MGDSGNSEVDYDSISKIKVQNQFAAQLESPVRYEPKGDEQGVVAIQNLGAMICAIFSNGSM